jgi:hypothetical protein
VRLHALTPPGVELRGRSNPAGPTRVNVHFFIYCQIPPGGAWREAPPCSPFGSLVLRAFDGGCPTMLESVTENLRRGKIAD